MFNWLKKLFKKNKEETSLPNPSSLIVGIHEWIHRLQSCENSIKEYNFVYKGKFRGESRTSYTVSDDKREIQIQKLVCGDKYDFYRDIFGGLKCELISKSYELYTLISVKKKEGDESISLPLGELFEIIRNEDNKPLLKEIYQRAEQLYTTSDEYKKKLQEDKDREDRLRGAAEMFRDVF